MGKNQTTTKEAQSHGVCQRIFKALSPAFRYFRRVSTVGAQTQSLNSATESRVATSTDHHRGDSPKATNMSFASNMVLVEYNHSSVGITNNNVKNMVTNVVHHIINDDHKSVQSEEYDADTYRFSKYINHVKNKMKTMSSFDDNDDDSAVGRAETRRDSFNDKVDRSLQVQDHGAA